MSVCLLGIGDGREEIHQRSLVSVREMLPRFDDVVLLDDGDHRLGFAGAIQQGWLQVIETGCEFVWHAEMDFLYRQRIPLERMIAVLKAYPRLAQISLKRQPVNVSEVEAGGIVEQAPEDYTQIVEHGDIWTEHRRYFTTNPSVYAAALCHQGWPRCDQSEGVFTARLLEDPKVRFGIWGAKFDEPLVEHIGERVGVGY